MIRARGPSGLRSRRELPFGDLLHQRRAEAGRGRYHRRCRCLGSLAGLGCHRACAGRCRSGRPSPSIRIIWSVFRRLYLPLRTAGLEAAAQGGGRSGEGRRRPLRVTKASDLPWPPGSEFPRLAGRWPMRPPPADLSASSSSATSRSASARSSAVLILKNGSNGAVGHDTVASR